MSVVELECLCIPGPRGMPHPLRAAIAEITSQLYDSGILYCFTGMIAYGVHGRARTTSSVELLIDPQRIDELRFARDLPARFGQPALEVSVASACRPEDRRAIEQAETHTLFANDISVSPARDLLWRLCRRDSLESYILAIELLAACRVDVDALRAEMENEGMLDVAGRLDIAVTEARLQPTRTYAASMRRRRADADRRTKY